MLSLQTGSLFGGRYIVQKPIGSGGMGAVYLATDPRYNNFAVALKVLYPGFIKTQEARERFKTEIIASYRITHRNVVRAYEYFDDSSVQAYAMELVDGSDLQVFLKEGGVAVEQALSILRQAAAGLYAIHQRGIIHRDLKPENILVGKNGIVKIADFGVARMRTEDSSLTQIGAMVGTPKYFAPEYIEAGEIDQRGDIYALGVIGYELISGCSPFRSNSQVSLMVERVKQVPPDLKSIAKNCPPDLAKIIEMAMRVSLSDRYQSAADMRTDLECVQNGRALLNWRPAQSNIEVKAAASIALVDTQPDRAVVHEGALSMPTSSANINVQIPNFWHVMLASFMLVTLVGIGGYYIFMQSAESLFDALKSGRYEGYVQGFLDGQSDAKITLWRDDQGIKISMDQLSCPSQSLNLDHSFRCQNNTYYLRLDLSNGHSALGRINTDADKYWARWSLSKVATNSIK